jgi:hypothetical protein
MFGYPRPITRLTIQIRDLPFCCYRQDSRNPYRPKPTQL